MNGPDVRAVVTGPDGISLLDGDIVMMEGQRYRVSYVVDRRPAAGGHWERELARRIAARSPRAIARGQVARLADTLHDITYRLTHARDALAGRDCPREEW